MSAAKLRERLQELTGRTPDLTGRQAEIVAFMLRCLLSGYLPSYREIGEEFGIGSPNGVAGHIKSLERKEYVECHHQQGYQLTDKALDLVL